MSDLSDWAVDSATIDDNWVAVPDGVSDTDKSLLESFIPAPQAVFKLSLKGSVFAQYIIVEPLAPFGIWSATTMDFFSQLQFITTPARPNLVEKRSEDPMMIGPWTLHTCMFKHISDASGTIVSNQMRYFWFHADHNEAAYAVCNWTP